MSDLAAALLVAIRVQGAQLDKSGDPYLWHVARVVEAVSDEAKVVAALHDVIEDSDLLGIPDVVGLDGAEQAAIDLLTRASDETYADYIEGITERARKDEGKRAQHRERGIIDRSPSAAMLAREVKLVDLRDNLDRIPTVPEGYERRGEWIERWRDLKIRYEKAIETLEASVSP